MAKTKNEAATSVLIPALDATLPQIREGALEALLERRSPASGKEILRRVHEMDDRWREIMSERGGRMTTALRDAILGGDPQMVHNGCQAILWFHEYDLMPALVNACEDASNEYANLAARTLVDLAELLYDELAKRRDYRRHRDPQSVRRHVCSSLELSLGRFSQHKRSEILETFLVVTHRDNTTLQRILRDPYHDAYLCLIDTLTRSPRRGVMRLLLSYLDDPHAPGAALRILARRRDEQFISHLASKIGFEPSATARANLKRISSIPWLEDGIKTIDSLDDAGQHSMLQLILASGISRLEAFKVVEHLFTHGKKGGRRG